MREVQVGAIPNMVDELAEVVSPATGLVSAGTMNLRARADYPFIVAALA